MCHMITRHSWRSIHTDHMDQSKNPARFSYVFQHLCVAIFPALLFQRVLTHFWQPTNWWKIKNSNLNVCHGTTRVWLGSLSGGGELRVRGIPWRGRRPLAWYQRLLTLLTTPSLLKHISLSTLKESKHSATRSKSRQCESTSLWNVSARPLSRVYNVLDCFSAGLRLGREFPDHSCGNLSNKHSARSHDVLHDDSLTNREKDSQTLWAWRSWQTVRKVDEANISIYLTVITTVMSF